MLTVTIDGQETEVEEGTLLIEAATQLGIHIPRFCYHEKLSIAANCRMCLVEVDNAPKVMPACATPVSEGMVVYTQTDKVKSAQRSVMDFLLMNHPLDCPVCDQAGECELQDVALMFGADKGQYTLPKRVVLPHDLGPLIHTEMTRCIHCTRCVRFGIEIAGQQELGAFGRGESTEIDSALSEALQSELSGNVIDLCPVGALTSKPYQFSERAWTCVQRPSIAAHDCLGASTAVHVNRQHQVVRVVPRRHEAINDVWLSDVDRFSYEGLNVDRLLSPQIKREERWESVHWDEAIYDTCRQFSSIVAQNPEYMAVLYSPNTTVETAHLIHQVASGLNMTQIGWQADRFDQTPTRLFDVLGDRVPLSDIANSDYIVVLGHQLTALHPLVALKVRQAKDNGATIVQVGDVRDQGCSWDAYYPMDTFDTSMPWHALQSAEKGLILVTSPLQMMPQYAAWLQTLKQQCEGQSIQILPLTLGTNAVGLTWLDQINRHTTQIYPLLEKGKRGYLIIDLEPEDLTWKKSFQSACEQADVLVVITPYKHPFWQAHATVLLPMTPVTEQAGSWINCEGRWQSFSPTTCPQGDSKPAWKILSVLAKWLQIPHFELQDIAPIQQQLKALWDNQSIESMDTCSGTQAMPAKKPTGYQVLPMHSPLKLDPQLRRATALQATQRAADYQVVRVSQKTFDAWAKKGDDPKIGWRVHDVTVQVPVAIEASLPDDKILVPWQAFGEALTVRPFECVELVQL